MVQNVNENGNGTGGDWDLTQLSQIDDINGGGPDPWSDVFAMGGGQPPLSVMREVWSTGDTEEDLLARIRATPEDSKSWIEMEHEEMWLESEGQPDEAHLQRMDKILTISRFGESRHELVDMYTHTRMPFQPQQWAKKAHNVMMKQAKQDPQSGG